MKNELYRKGNPLFQRDSLFGVFINFTIIPINFLTSRTPFLSLKSRYFRLQKVDKLESALGFEVWYHFNCKPNEKNRKKNTKKARLLDWYPSTHEL